MRLTALALVVLLGQEKALFEEKFDGKLSDGWTVQDGAVTRTGLFASPSGSGP